MRHRNTGHALAAAAFAAFLPTGASAADATDANSGARLYAEHCAICHKPDLSGEAYWSRTKPTGKVPAPPLGKGSHAAHYSGEQLETIIRWGVDELGMQGYTPTMPEFDAVLSEGEIAALVAFLIRHRETD